MTNQRLSKQPTTIFSAALWSQQRLWQEAARLLPRDAYLLVADTTNKKQSQLMKRVARLLSQKGRLVYTWEPAKNQAERFEDQNEQN